MANGEQTRSTSLAPGQKYGLQFALWYTEFNDLGANLGRSGLHLGCTRPPHGLHPFGIISAAYVQILVHSAAIRNFLAEAYAAGQAAAKRSRKRR